VILAVIQARMNSTRLPGKVMLPILEKPIIWHIHERLKFVKKINAICISTSTSKSDDLIANFANENGIKCYRGDENNLIVRHLGAADFFNADSIVRINADCPFVDPEIVDKVISLYEKNSDVDFVSNDKVPTYPFGLNVELMPKRTLEALLPISKNPIFYEYFISLYIYEHPEIFTSVGLELDRPNLLRWTLDYAEDYEFVKQIYSHLYKPDKVFHMRDILDLLKEKPDLGKINSMYDTKLAYLKYQDDKKNQKMD